MLKPIKKFVPNFKMLSIAIIVFFTLPVVLSAQQVQVEGYVFEDNNRGYLNEVKITILEENTKIVLAEVESNAEGFFSCSVPQGRLMVLKAKKDVFYPKEVSFSSAGKAEGEKVFVNVKMERQPGYLFELTLAEDIAGSDQTNAVVGTRVEVYNHSTDSLEVDIREHPSSFFSYTLQQGNHYTILIRKQGYFNKRIEAYVNVEGCIVCIDGVSNLTPGVTDNLTEGLQMGTLLANLEMEKAELNKAIQIENIYYDYNSANIRPEAKEELNKLIAFLKENPVLLVEIGSHTDSRGYARYNRELSQKRAQSVVDYVTQVGNLELERITAKGYGESALKNHCADGVKCTEALHQQNRRTELKIIGFSSFDPLGDMSLRDIIVLEKEEELLREIQNSEVIQVKSEEELPEEVRKQLKKQKKGGG